MHSVTLGDPVEGLDEHGTEVRRLVVQQLDLRPEKKPNDILKHFKNKYFFNLIISRF
jgi:hypothetical protein